MAERAQAPAGERTGRIVAGTPGQPQPQAWRDRPVTLTGGSGFLGRAVARRLVELGAGPRIVRSSEHDLRDQGAAAAALADSDVVIHCAASVGGIGFNQANPAPQLRENLLIDLNVVEAARLAGASKLVIAGSVCAYPKLTPVPFREDEIWNGYPEETNGPYGIAKRVGQELAAAYRRQYGLDAVVPLLANLYGPGDHFEEDRSHVIPALIRRFLEARERGADVVSVWGTGSASREFLYVDDAARALLLAAERLGTAEPVNIGTGTETTIRALAETIRALTGFEGEISWDASKPDGQPERRLDTSRARELLGFEAEVGLEEGLRRTVEWYRTAQASAAAQARP
jgi:GDP-L-fucose synthase